MPDKCDISFAFEDSRHAIEMLKVNQCPGLDQLQSEHYKYTDKALACLLAMVMNSMVVYGYIPQSAMDTIIIPVIKDKNGQVTDKNNYRPVAITSVFSGHRILSIFIQSSLCMFH